MKFLPENPERILIRSTNWIGDAIMTTPAVRTIRQNFPKTEITLLALPWVADIFCACPHIDHIFLYDKTGRHQGLSGKLKLASDLRAEQFELAFLLQNAFEAALITTLARIPVRAGYTTDGRRFLLTHRVNKRTDIGRKHQVHYYQEMLQGLGLKPGPDTLELYLDPAAVLEAGVMLGQAGQPLIGLNPGAAYGPAKRWPAKKYGQLGAQLVAATGGLIVVFGTDADREAAREISEVVGERVLNLCGKTSLGVALACIDRCRVFITNDSGLMHVAAALKTPLVALFGSTDHVATGPYCEQATVIRTSLACTPCMKTHCPHGHYQCMEQIGVSEVTRVVLNLLEKRDN